MLHLNSLATCVLAAICLAPTAQAFTPITHSSAIEQPAQNLQAQLSINVSIGAPPSSQRVIVVERSSYPQETIVVERSIQRYPINVNWGKSHGHHHGFHKNGKYKKGGHSKHRQDRYENYGEYRH